MVSLKIHDRGYVPSAVAPPGVAEALDAKSWRPVAKAFHVEALDGKPQAPRDGAGSPQIHDRGYAP